MSVKPILFNTEMVRAIPERSENVRTSNLPKRRVNTDVWKDNHGNFRDEYIYEIVKRGRRNGQK